MIFFILLKTARQGKDYGEILIHSVPEKYPNVKGDEYIVIAWNEVFPLKGEGGIEGLLDEIIKAARADPVCVDLRKQSIEQFGLDPFLDDAGTGNNLTLEETKKIVFNTLRDWAHPMVGNLANSPQIRPSTKESQYISNWSGCQFLDDRSKTAIQELFEKMPLMVRASRDQVRICYTIVDLARAFIGEVTSYVSRQLEEIMALRLCKSVTLHGSQVDMLVTFAEIHGAVFKSIIQKSKRFKWSHFEYSYYYMPPEVQKLTRMELLGLVDVLIEGATLGELKAEKLGGEPSTDGYNELVVKCKKIWRTIPYTVRCAILMNDIRKMWVSNSAYVKENHQIDLKTANPVKYSMGFTLLPGQDGFQELCEIVPAADQSHVPKFRLPSRARTGWELAWSWNRHERHPATIAYRHFLCPLWAGPSGHTGGGLQFWFAALGERVPQKCSQVITSGLFTLWRLYYDKRISGFHTMAETYEASCNQNVIGDIGKKQFAPKKDIPTDFSNVQDDMDLLKFAGVVSENSPIPRKQSFVNPIRLLLVLKAKYYDATPGTHTKKLNELGRLVIQAKDSLTEKGYKVLQWTDEISQKKGTNVQEFNLMLSPLRFIAAGGPIDVPDGALPILKKHFDKKTSKNKE